MKGIGILQRLLGRPRKAKPRASIGFVNHVKVVVRRAKRDEQGVSLKDAEGNVIYEEEVEIYEQWNVTCNVGLDAAKDRLFNSATTETTAHYICLSESNHTPVATDTLVPDEITQNGLERAAGTYDTTGCSIGECIVKNTFTAGGSFSNVQLMGLLDAASDGDLYFEATFTAVALESDDQLTASWDKITLS